MSFQAYIKYLIGLVADPKEKEPKRNDPPSLSNHWLGLFPLAFKLLLRKD
jgi:hypothetical protein